MLQLIKDIALRPKGIYASRVGFQSTGSGINYISNLLHGGFIASQVEVERKPRLLYDGRSDQAKLVPCISHINTDMPRCPPWPLEGSTRERRPKGKIQVRVVLSLASMVKVEPST